MQKRSSIKFVHYLRAVGTISVVYAHWGMMFYYHPDICSRLSFYEDFHREYVPFLIRITQSDIFNFGWFGVALFFLISGFLSSISWQNRNIGQFIAKRALRLYPCYTVGLLFTGGVLYLSALMNGVEFSYSYDAFIKNLSLFRPWFFVPSIDGVNWTMEVDVFYYLICIGCVCVGYKINNTQVHLFISLIGAIVIYLTHCLFFDSIATTAIIYKYFHCINFFTPFMPIIFIGTAIWNHIYEGVGKRNTVLYIVCFFLIFCFDCRITNMEKSFGYWISYGCAISVFVLLCYTRNAIEEISSSFLDFIGDISFAFYIIHGAAGYAVLAWLFKHGLGLWSFLVAGIFFLLLSYFLHFFVEQKVNVFARKWIG